MLPQNTVKLLGAVIPIDRFILTGIVIVLAAALAALYRFTRFGLQTRAASENEVAAMLGGLSPNRLSMVNTLLASAIAGGIGILAASITQLDTETLPLQIVPALAAALIAGFTSFGIACAAGIGLGHHRLADPVRHEPLLVPDRRRRRLAGRVRARGVHPDRAVHVPPRRESAHPRRARRAAPARGAAPPQAGRDRADVAVVCAVALVVLPFDFREALVNTMIGTLIALSLVVITGFVGQISVVQLTLAGVSGFAISHLAVNAGIAFPIAPLLGAGVALILGLITAASALRVRGVSLAVVTLAAVVAITNFGFINTTWGGGQTGSPGARAEAARARSRAARRVPRTGREPPEPGLRLGRAGGDRGAVRPRRAPAPGVARAAHARGALQRARRRRGRRSTRAPSSSSRSGSAR